MITFESSLLGVLVEQEYHCLAAVSDVVSKVPLSPTVRTYSLPHGTLKELPVNAALAAIMTAKEKVSVGDLVRIFNVQPRRWNPVPLRRCTLSEPALS